MEVVELTGQAYSPINPSWIFGPIDITFDLGSGTHGAPVTNFDMTWAGQHIDFAAGSTANEANGAIAVFGPTNIGPVNTSNFVFVHNADGSGGFRDSEQTVYIHFNSMSITNVPIHNVGEPGILALFALAFCIGVIRHAAKA